MLLVSVHYLCYWLREHSLFVLLAQEAFIICVIGSGSVQYLCYWLRERSLFVLLAQGAFIICGSGSDLG